MRRTHAVAVLSMCVIGCASDPPSVARVVVPVDLSPPAPPVAAPTPSTSAPAPPARRSGKALLTIPLPDPILCELTTAQAGYRRIPLALVAGGRPFGSVTPARGLSVFVPRGDARLGMTVEADAAGVFVRGVARAEAVALHATRVSVFAGFAVPRSVADLHLVRAGDEGLELRLELPPQVETSSKQSLTATLPCAIVSLTSEEFDPMQNLLGVPIDEAFLTGARAPLSLSSEGAPVATLVPHDVDRHVSVLVRDKKRVKIAWAVGDVVVFGWVDAQKVRPRAREEEAYGAGGLGLAGTGSGSSRSIVCDVEVPLRAEVDGASEVVGVIAAGTRIQIMRERELEFEVELPLTGLRADPGASLLVERALGKRCTSP